MITQKNNLLESVGLIFKISCILAAVGFVVFFFVFTFKFACGWLIGSGFCMFYLFLLALLVKNLFKDGAKDNTMLRFGMMFIGKTGILLLILGVIIYFFSKMPSRDVLFGFIAGLFMLPVSVVLFTVYNGLKNR